MTVVASEAVGDVRERTFRVGFFGQTFYRDGRSFYVRNERVWVRERFQSCWEGAYWSMTSWRVLPREANKEQKAVEERLQSYAYREEGL